LTFKVLIGLQTPTGGSEIDNKIDGIMALHSGLMSGVSCAKPSVTQPLNVPSFKAMKNT